MQQIKDKLIKDLVTDLTDKDIVRLLEVVQTKLDKGASAMDIGVHLVNATAQVIQYAFPDLPEDVVLELAEDVSDAIIDRVIEHVGGFGSNTIAQEKIPDGQLN